MNNAFQARPTGNGRVLTPEQQLAHMKAQLEQELLALVERNKAGFADLQRQGINFDQSQILSARVDTLINSIASAFGPQGEVWAVQCRLDWEQFVAQQIAAASEQGTKAQLSLGGRFTPEMIRQLARETGSVGHL